jgi:hypothetical protein
VTACNTDRPAGTTLRSFGPLADAPRSLSLAEGTDGRGASASGTGSSTAVNSSPAAARCSQPAPLVTSVLLKVTGCCSGLSWWESLGMPPPWKWGDDQASVYIVGTSVAL